ncbi:MAG: acyl carrier protein [Rhodospirillaceae bacterium]|nr:acyl carrier protein [Rhodospirillaceae bacterium]
MTQVQPTAPEAPTITGIFNPSVANQVRDIIARVLGIAPDRVVEAADFAADLGASSLDLVELIMAIEDAFGIEIPDSAAERIATVGDLLVFIRSQAPTAEKPAQS